METLPSALEFLQLHVFVLHRNFCAAPGLSNDGCGNISQYSHWTFKQQQREGKIKNLTRNGGILTQKKEVGTQCEMNGVPRRGNRGLCCVDIQPRKETVLCLPLTVEVYAVPSQLGGQWGLPCLPGRTDSEWPVNTASANNLRALLTGKEAGCPAGPNWECWGAASPKDTSVTWICDFHHSNCWCWRQNDSRGKKRSSQEGILGFYKEERETTEDEMLG